MSSFSLWSAWKHHRLPTFIHAKDSKSPGGRPPRCHYRPGLCRTATPSARALTQEVCSWKSNPGGPHLCSTRIQNRPQVLPVPCFYVTNPLIVNPSVRLSWDHVCRPSWERCSKFVVAARTGRKWKPGTPGIEIVQQRSAMEFKIVVEWQFFQQYFWLYSLVFQVYLMLPS